MTARTSTRTTSSFRSTAPAPPSERTKSTSATETSQRFVGGGGGGGGGGGSTRQANDVSPANSPSNARTVTLNVPAAVSVPVMRLGPAIFTFPVLRRLTVAELVTVTIEDPTYYSKPFTVTFTARLQGPNDEILENICQENNQYGPAGGHQNPFFGK